MREKSLYPKISELFKKDYDIIFEYKLPDNSGREIDILCLNKRKPEIIAIETKIRDWRTALRQAFTRLFYVDRSYIALPEKYLSKIDKVLAKKYGIGVISVDGHAKIVQRAEKSSKVMKWRKEMIIKDISIFQDDT